VRRLEDKGLLAIAPKISERDPYAREIILPTQSLTMNADQARALAEITAALQGAGPPPRAFLLHGVTGSGKTEVYLQAIALALEQGKGAIVLVAGDFAHAANGGTIQGALQFRAATNAGRRVAQPLVSRGTP